jgi:hypothetical protein
MLVLMARGPSNTRCPMVMGQGFVGLAETQMVDSRWLLAIC